MSLVQKLENINLIVVSLELFFLVSESDLIYSVVEVMQKLVTRGAYSKYGSLRLYC